MPKHGAKKQPWSRRARSQITMRSRLSAEPPDMIATFATTDNHSRKSPVTGSATVLQSSPDHYDRTAHDDQFILRTEHGFTLRAEHGFTLRAEHDSPPSRPRPPLHPHHRPRPGSDHPHHRHRTRRRRRPSKRTRTPHHTRRTRRRRRTVQPWGQLLPRTGCPTG